MRLRFLFAKCLVFLSFLPAKCIPRISERALADTEIHSTVNDTYKLRAITPLRSPFPFGTIRGPFEVRVLSEVEDPEEAAAVADIASSQDGVWEGAKRQRSTN